MSLLSQIFSNNSPYDKKYFLNLSNNPYVYPDRIDVFRNELQHINKIYLKTDVASQMLIALRNIIIINRDNDQIVSYELMNLLFKYYKSDNSSLNDTTLTCLCYIMNTNEILNYSIFNSPEIDFVNQLYVFLTKKVFFSRELIHTSLLLINNSKEYFDARFHLLLFNLFVDLEDPYLSARAIEVLQNIASSDEILKIIPVKKPKFTIYKKNISAVKQFMHQYYKC